MSKHASHKFTHTVQPRCYLRLLPCLRCLPWFLLCLASITAHGAELKLGTAAVTINPPTGIGLAGYYHERGHEGVLDDIGAKATVLDDGQTRAAIVVCDLIAMPKWLVTEARKQVAERTGIPGTNVMIAATHTHTAPILSSRSNDSLNLPPLLIQRRFDSAQCECAHRRPCQAPGLADEFCVTRRA